MTEKNLVDSTPFPATVESIKHDLASLGVQPGMVLLVHSSLSALGWVNGGPVAVILALEEALGPQGTLVMPTHSGDLSDPKDWQHPPVPESWWETIYASMPVYDPSLTPTRKIGVIPETFRKQDSVLRSAHPQLSFAAWGYKAETILQGHELAYSLGEHSPLAQIYELGGSVLLLGVEHDSNTSIHLAEYRAQYSSKKFIKEGAPVIIDNRRQWVEFSNIDLNSDDFSQIGAAFDEETGLVIKGKVAQADALLMPQKDLVDYSVRWMEKNRG